MLTASKRTGPSVVSNAIPSTLSGEPKHGSKSIRNHWECLRASLPTGWENYFSARRAGRAFGLEISCPVCGEKPPRSVTAFDHPLYNYQKWRWLAVHQSEHAKADALKHRRIVADEKRRLEAQKRGEKKHKPKTKAASAAA